MAFLSFGEDVPGPRHEQCTQSSCLQNHSNNTSGKGKTAKAGTDSSSTASRGSWAGRAGSALGSRGSRVAGRLGGCAHGDSTRGRAVVAGSSGLRKGSVSENARSVCEDGYVAYGSRRHSGCNARGGRRDLRCDRAGSAGDD